MFVEQLQPSSGSIARSGKATAERSQIVGFKIGLIDYLVVHVR